ncbi:twin-arginine translocase TatA/TatE family subunit [archaeon SCG-AAA382B04]|nr:twin-arginine translocase TatA/TatE family subunit [archaeon SCG-AAA382B04]
MGGSEWILILLAIVLLFGASKLPKLASSMGQAMGEFKKARTKAEQEARKAKYEAIESDPESEETDYKQIADDLGIDTEGKSKEEIKKEIRQKVGSEEE